MKHSKLVNCFAHSSSRRGLPWPTALTDHHSIRYDTTYGSAWLWHPGCEMLSQMVRPIGQQAKQEKHDARYKPDSEPD